MNRAVETMLKQYRLHAVGDYELALKEILQEIALLGLYRARFFEHAAYYGGSALRVLYDLNRFSEDMDFSLLKPDPTFKLNRYCGAVERELRGFGFELTVEPRLKQFGSTIESAFIKAGTMVNMINIKVPASIRARVHGRKLLKFKLEVDIDPPAGFTTEAKYLFRPIPFSVRTYTLPDLFAGKMHALLCRPWASRVKGRDWYDFVWYVARGTPLNLVHLEQRMRQSGHHDAQASLDIATFKARLRDHILNTDLQRARLDVLPFLDDPTAVQVWSPDFFQATLEAIRFA